METIYKNIHEHLSFRRVEKMILNMNITGEYMIYIGMIALGIVILFFIMQYNALIRLKNFVAEAWSGIDVQLKRRYDLIPNLVATVKGYSSHEKQTLEEVVRLRNNAMQAKSIEEKGKAEAALTAQLKTVFALAEAYPDLKANQNFLELQKNLADLENHIQLARRYYNGVVREYNTKIHVFPNTLIARIGNFAPSPYFELGASSERENPTVNF